MGHLPRNISTMCLIFIPAVRWNYLLHSLRETTIFKGSSTGWDGNSKILLENFRDWRLICKTVKVFHHERFALYGIMYMYVTVTIASIHFIVMYKHGLFPFIDRTHHSYFQTFKFKIFCIIIGIITNTCVSSQ